MRKQQFHDKLNDKVVGMSHCYNVLRDPPSPAETRLPCRSPWTHV